MNDSDIDAGINGVTIYIGSNNRDRYNFSISDVICPRKKRLIHK